MGEARDRTLARLDPELVSLLDMLPELVFTKETLPQLRIDILTILASREDSQAQPRHALAPGRDGAPDVPLLIYNGEGAQDRPAILYIHGGGMVIGSAHMASARLAGWAERLGAVGVSVEYRLAPETPFPGPQEDCYAALQWMVVHADAIGINPARIVVIGESAGGCLAASLALMVRDRGDLPLAGQALIYPMLDHRTGTDAGLWRNAFAGHLGWKVEDNRFGWDCLRGDYMVDDSRKGWFSPALAEDLSGLPPCFISAAALDLLVDEDMDYARRLNAAGVAVEAHLYPGAIHGFDMFPTAQVSRQANADIEAWLAAHIHSTI
ncbi:alpha/beta hydrolase [Sphingobium sp. HBC34]|uniref:Alpha/beta hydrolase n=1 Tax=Sphingobium cyanobacteriorum TaxID=3063954 RepID=A0ABT8ZQB9_9SPHN|nr:alpha/beta hydrolase [Sphingobium sp. HBC34]MDO7836716.1 alpha/beta hydrolase [Sphingobium sp. HBC34]